MPGDCRFLYAWSRYSIVAVWSFSGEGRPDNYQTMSDKGTIALGGKHRSHRRQTVAVAVKFTCGLSPIIQLSYAVMLTPPSQGPAELAPIANFTSASSVILSCTVLVAMAQSMNINRT